MIQKYTFFFAQKHYLWKNCNFKFQNFKIELFNPIIKNLFDNFKIYNIIITFVMIFENIQFITSTHL